MAGMEARLHDMHVHLGFMANAVEVSAQARAAGSLLFANTVTPDDWLADSATFAEFDNVRVGFGMHPWWVGGKRGEAIPIKRVVDLLDEHDPRLLGEIGLDFGKRQSDTRDEQIQMFRAIVSWAANRGDKLLSLHSVRAAENALDILLSCDALDSCAVVFHWFTGPSDQLKRAIDAGCYFSVGARMVATGKGREYTKAIPVEQLLLETDAPPEQGEPYAFDSLTDDLRTAANVVAALKGADALEQIAETSRRLLETR